MRCDALPDAPLSQRLPNETQFEIAQIAQPAMNQFRIVGAGRVSEIIGFDESHLQSTQRSVPRDTRARRTAPDDTQVELIIGEASEIAMHGRVWGGDRLWATLEAN